MFWSLKVEDLAAMWIPIAPERDHSATVGSEGMLNFGAVHSANSAFSKTSLAEGGSGILAPAYYDSG